MVATSSLVFGSGENLWETEGRQLSLQCDIRLASNVDWGGLEAEPTEPHHRKELGFNDASYLLLLHPRLSGVAPHHYSTFKRLSEPKGVNKSLPISQLRFRGLMELT